MGQASKNPKVKYLNKRRLVVLVVILLFLYVVLPQIGNLKDSFAQIKGANFGWLILGLLATLGTYLAAAGQYFWLSLKPLRFSTVFAVEGASAFTNRLLPAGLGGMSLNFTFLRKIKHSRTEAGVVVATNDVLGFFSNVIIIAIIASLGVKLSFAINVPIWGYYLAGFGLVAVLLALIFIAKLRTKIIKLFTNIKKSLATYKSHPLRLLFALALAGLLSLCYAVALYASMHSIGLSVPISQVFLVYIGSVIVATATPTPGGLVGAEAAIVAGFAVYGVAASTGLAIALIYRLITYWIPLIIGFVIFEVLRRRQII